MAQAEIVAAASEAQQAIVTQLCEDVEAGAPRENLDAYLKGLANPHPFRAADPIAPTSKTPWFPRQDGRSAERTMRSASECDKS